MDAPGVYRNPGTKKRGTSKNREFYSSPQWRRLSALVRRRDPICTICGERPSKQVDHIQAIEDGGDRYALSNLRGVCLQCHGEKTWAEVKERGS